MGILTQWRRAEQQRRNAESSELLARQNAYAADMDLAQTALERGELGTTVASLEAQRPGPGQKDLRGWEWRYFWQRLRSDERFQLCRYSDSIVGLAFSSDGKRLALRREHGAVALWDTVARKSVAELPDVGGSKEALAFSPQGNLLAYGNSASNGMPGVSLWNITTRQATWLPHSAAADYAVFSPDGTLLATLAGDGKVRLWQIESGQVLTNFQTAEQASGSYCRMVFSPDGRTIAFGRKRVLCYAKSDWEILRRD